MATYPRAFLRDAVNTSLHSTAQDMSSKLDELRENIEKISVPQNIPAPLPFSAKLSQNIEDPIIPTSAPIEEEEDYFSDPLQIQDNEQFATPYLTDPISSFSNPPMEEEIPIVEDNPFDYGNEEEEFQTPIQNQEIEGDGGTGPTDVRKLSPLIKEASDKFGVPNSIIAGIMEIESGGRSRDENGNPLRSSAGAMGPMQVMPFHFQEGEDGDDLRTNVFKGAKLLADHFREYKDWGKAAARYFGALINGEITERSDGGTTGSGYVSKFENARSHYSDLDSNDSSNPEYPNSFDIADQGNSGFSAADAQSACGPVLAAAFARANGRNPTEQEALELAKSKGLYETGSGMKGAQATVQLIEELSGGDAYAESGANWDKIKKDINAGNPVGISTNFHYFGVDQYNPRTDKFHVGRSGTNLREGSEWMSASEIERIGQGGTTSIFVDSPISDGLSIANKNKNTSKNPDEDLGYYSSRLGGLIDKIGQTKDSAFEGLGNLGRELGKDRSLREISELEPVRNTFDLLGKSWNDSAGGKIGESLNRDLLDSETGTFGASHKAERESNLESGNYGELAKNILGEAATTAYVTPSNAILAGLQSLAPSVSSFKPINFTPEDPNQAFGLSEIISNVILPATALEKAGFGVGKLMVKGVQSVGSKLGRDAIDIVDEGSKVVGSIQDLAFPLHPELATSPTFAAPVNGQILDRPNLGEPEEIISARTDLQSLSPSQAADEFGGATFDTSTGLHYDPAAGGYAVSNAGGKDSLILKSDGNGNITSPNYKGTLDEAIQRYTSENQEVLDQPNVFLGVWKKGTDYHLDATTIHEDLREAFWTTWQRRQELGKGSKAIYQTFDFSKMSDTKYPIGLRSAGDNASKTVGKLPTIYESPRGEQLGVDSALEWAQYRQYDRLLEKGEIQDWGVAGPEYVMPYIHTDPKGNKTVVKYFAPDSWYKDKDGRFILNEIKSDWIRGMGGNPSKEASLGYVEPGKIIPVSDTQFAFPDGTRPDNVFIQITNDRGLSLREPGTFSDYLKGDAKDYLERFGNIPPKGKWSAKKVSDNIASINSSSHRNFSQTSAGAAAGLEPETDEEGNITGIGFSPERAALGMGATNPGIRNSIKRGLTAPKFTHQQFSSTLERDLDTAKRMGTAPPELRPSQGTIPGDPLRPSYGTQSNFEGLAPENMFGPNTASEPLNATRPPLGLTQRGIEGMDPEDFFNPNSASNLPGKLPRSGRDVMFPEIETSIPKDPPKGIKAQDWLHATRYTSMLSGVATSVANIATGTYMISRKLLVDSISQSPDKTAAEIKGMIGGFSGALESSLQTLLHGTSDISQDLASRRGKDIESVLSPRSELGELEGIPGMIGKGLSITTNVLRTPDEFFHQLGLSAELGRLSVIKGEKLAEKYGIPLKEAIEHIIKGQDKETLEMAAKVADKLTFRKPLEGMSLYAQLMIDNSPGGMGKVLVPFIHAIHNMTATAVEELPGIGALRPDLSLSKSQRIASQGLSMATGGAALFMASNGNLSGAGPSDQKERERLERDGWMPNAVKLGGKWYQHTQLGPLSATLSAAANAWESSQDQEAEGIGGKIKDFAQDFVTSMTQSTYARGILELSQLMSKDASEAQIDNFFASQLSTLNPVSGILNTFSQSNDPLTRDPQGVGERLQNRTPLRTSLPSRINNMGQEVPNPKFGIGTINPFRTNSQVADEADKELGKFKIPLSKVPDTIGTMEVKLSREDDEKFQRLAGGLLQSKVQDEMSNPKYNNYSDAEKTKLLTKARDFTRAQAQDSVIDRATTMKKPAGEPPKYYGVKDSIEENRIEIARAKVNQWQASLETNTKVPTPTNSDFERAEKSVLTYEYKLYLNKQAELTLRAKAG